MDQLDKVRQNFYPKFNKLLISEKFTPQPAQNTIHWIAPVMHGSNFFPDQSDDFKFAVLDLLFDAISEVDARFIRMGCFHASLVKGDKNSLQKQAIAFGLVNVLFALSNQEEAFQIVFELDKELLKREIQTTADSMCGFYCMGEHNTEVAFRRFIGHFFAPKSELGCQIADVVGYSTLKKMAGTSVYQKRFGAYSDKLMNQYLLNEITWINAPNKTVRYPQHYNNTLSRSIPIVPSE